MDQPSNDSDKEARRIRLEQRNKQKARSDEARKLRDIRTERKEQRDKLYDRPSDPVNSRIDLRRVIQRDDLAELQELRDATSASAFQNNASRASPYMTTRTVRPGTTPILTDPAARPAPPAPAIRRERSTGTPSGTSTQQVNDLLSDHPRRPAVMFHHDGTETPVDADTGKPSGKGKGRADDDHEEDDDEDDPPIPPHDSVSGTGSGFGEDDKERERKKPVRQRAPGPPGPGGDPDGSSDDEPASDDDFRDLHDPKDVKGSRMIRRMARAFSVALSNGLSQRTERKANVRSPDPFDGTKPSELPQFLFMGELNFDDRPRSFRQDRQKVTYMISHMTGVALEWFQTQLIETRTEPVPVWYDDYEEFVMELRLSFGTLDPAGDAEAELETLRMPTDQRINIYMTRFNTLGSRAGWDARALRRQFYRGLPDRIQEALGRLPGGKPATLSGMKVNARAIDASYWERKRELQDRRPDGRSDGRSRSGRFSSTPSTTAPATSATAPGSGPASGSGTTSGPAPSSGSSKNKGSSSRAPASASAGSKPFANQLGPDGKLSSSERQRRMDNNLCLFCGTAGHRIAECNKRTSASARAAAVDNGADDTSA